MYTHQIMGVCTSLLYFILTFQFKMAACNCDWKFENTFFDELSKTGPVAFSPLNIQSNLEFAAAHAKRLTREEINDIGKANFSTSGNFKYHVVNYLSKDNELMPCVLADFYTELKRVDFKNPNDTTELSLLFSYQNYEQKKRTILPEKLPVIFALLSTFYFKEKWEKPFTSEKKEGFDKIMYHQYNSFLYRNLTFLNAVAVEMPFKNSDTKMLVLMPNDNDLQRLSTDLLPVDLRTITKHLKFRELSLFFPKLRRVAIKRSLIKPLQKLGMKAAFTKEANFALQACGDDTYIKEFRTIGQQSNGLKYAHFMSLTGVQWDLTDTNYINKATDTDYDSKADKSIETFKSEEADDSNTIEVRSRAKSVAFDRPFFYAIIDLNRVVFVGAIKK